MALKLPADESFLTSGVLEYLDLDLRTVCRLEAGSLPAGRVGRHWRFRERDLDAWPGAGPARDGAASPQRRILPGDDERGILLTKPFSAPQVLESAARALGVPDA